MELYIHHKNSWILINKTIASLISQQLTKPTSCFQSQAITPLRNNKSNLCKLYLWTMGSSKQSIWSGPSKC